MQEPTIRVATKEEARAIENLIFEWSKEQWSSWQVERVKTILQALEDKNHLILVSKSPKGIKPIETFFMDKENFQKEVKEALNSCA
jgi:hypothetical protein